MKKIYLSLIALIFCFSNAKSQCTSGPMDGVINVTNVFQTINVPTGAPSYFQFNGFAGVTYTFTYCYGGGSFSYDTYLTITDNSANPYTQNDDYCSLGSYLSFNCPSNGIYRIYTSACCPCGNKGGSAQLAYANDGCVNNTPENVTNMPFGVICSGQSATLSVTSEDVPNWYASPAGPVIATGATYITPTLSAGTYTFYASKNSTVCSNPRIPVTVTVIPSPVISITGGGAAACPGTTVNLTASGANSYLWSNGISNSTVNVTPNVTTAYTVVGTVGNCTAQAVKNVSVNPTIAITGNTLYCAGTGTSVLNATGANTYTWSTGALTSFIIVSPTVTTTYSVTGRNTLGACNNTQVVTVVIASTPTVLISGSLTACDEQPTTLTASGANSYFWSNGSATATSVVTPFGTTTVSVIGTSAAGCTAVTVQTINVLYGPNVTITAPGKICTGESTVLNGNGATGYSWNTGATTSSISVSPTVTTTYTVVGTHTVNTCPRAKTVTVAVNACVNIKSYKSSEGLLLVYPNPSNGMFTVELNNEMNKTIEILDVAGRVLSTIKTSETKSDINISNLANGIYFVKLSCDFKNVMVTKITKQ